MRMFEVFYDGVQIGIVKSNPALIKGAATAFLHTYGPRSDNGRDPNFVPNPPYDLSKLTYSDKNHNKYRHMM